MIPNWCYGNASTRKRLNTESDPKKTETSRKWIFLRRFLFFQKLSEIPQIQFLEEFPVFFWSVSSIFRSDSGLSGSYIVEGFPNIFEGFPNIFDPFPHFLGPFPVFRKSLKFSVCWSVSSFFGSVSSFFGSVSGFQKNNLILSLLIGFLFFGSVSSFFGSVSGFEKKF